jgi:hypothetical protein
MRCLPDHQRLGDSPETGLWKVALESHLGLVDVAQILFLSAGCKLLIPMPVKFVSIADQKQMFVGLARFP